MKRVMKFDDELQIVYGEVYAPNVGLDSQGDFMEADVIRKMAHNFLAEGRQANIDVNHNHQMQDAVVVESFIARKKDPDGFIEGSWVVGVHIQDPELWQDVKDGKINGFSLEARVKSRQVELEMDLPSEIEGVTSKSEGHVHKYTVYFDDDGNFAGGLTDEAAGHSHRIKSGTVTEPPDGESDGHRHRYSFVELLES